jgi:uncharacterized protein (DUF1778 family)
MPESEAVLVQFRATPEMRDWFKHAAHEERKTLSEWLRSMAIVRAAELVPQPKSSTLSR